MTSLVATAALGLAGTASAQSSSNTTTPSAYVGANVGLYNKYSIGCDAGASCDRTAKLGGKIYGGYDFGGYGVEALAFGVKSAQGSVRPGATSVPGSVSETGAGVVGVLPYAVGDFTLKGKLGLAYVRGKASYAGGVSDKSMFTPLVGASVAYPINKTVSLSADWDQFRAKYAADRSVHVNMFSVGLSTKF
jgi:hypothetical protein